jgi:hypothetical protein
MSHSILLRPCWQADLAISLASQGFDMLQDFVIVRGSDAWG